MMIVELTLSFGALVAGLLLIGVSALLNKWVPQRVGYVLVAVGAGIAAAGLGWGCAAATFGPGMV